MSMMADRLSLWSLMKHSLWVCCDYLFNGWYKQDRKDMASNRTSQAVTVCTDAANEMSTWSYTGQKAIAHQVTTTLVTSKNVLFLGHNHVLTTGTDDLSLAGAWGDNQSVRSSAPVVRRWFWHWNRIFLKVDSMVVTWWIVAFLHCDCIHIMFHEHWCG